MFVVSEHRNRCFGYLTLPLALNSKKNVGYWTPVQRKGTEIDVVMTILLLTERPKIPLKDQRKFKQPGEVLMVMRWKFGFNSSPLVCAVKWSVRWVQGRLGGKRRWGRNDGDEILLLFDNKRSGRQPMPLLKWVNECDHREECKARSTRCAGCVWETPCGGLLKQEQACASGRD